MRIYLAGPMRSKPDYNYPAFHEAAEYLRDVLGLEVVNPADLFDGDTTRPAEDYLYEDIKNLIECEEVYVLPGWQASAGARVEVQVARALGLPVIDYDTGSDIEVTDLPIELEAATHVYGERQASYGHPATDFERTGKIWGAILGIDPVPPELVALCMAGLKISREVNKPGRDNLVDLIGYTICKKRIEDAKAS